MLLELARRPVREFGSNGRASKSHMNTKALGAVPLAKLSGGMPFERATVAEVDLHIEEPV